LRGEARQSGDEVLLERQALHARALTFVNPQTGREMTFEAPIPPDLRRVLDVLEDDASSS
jgi:23S rRNA pseudouridine1911/1915/1917 synthase